jgi:threonine dehydratase
MLSELDAPTLADVRNAARSLKGVALDTPCLRSDALSHLTGADVVLKFENRQHTGSYKMRGAYIKLMSLDEDQRRQGVLTASAGNHAQGTAFAAMRLRIGSTVVMPETTPYCKIRSTEGYGARVLLHGATIADALTEARRIAQEKDKTLVVPFDDPAIIAGAGTVGLEMLCAFPDLQVLLVQVGGGGLISGIALAAKSINPMIRVIGIQTELYPGLYNARHALPPPVGGATLAEGVAVETVGDLNLAMAETLVDDVLLIDEEALEYAVHLLLEEEKTLVEGAGAVGVAGLLRYAKRFRDVSVGLILSGGNIDTGLLAYIISRVRLRQRRVVCLRVHMLDAPGGLARVAEVVAQHGANILEVSHRRMFTNVLAKCTQLDLTVELLHPEDIETIVRRLNAAGCDTAFPFEKSP